MWRRPGCRVLRHHPAAAGGGQAEPEPGPRGGGGVRWQQHQPAAATAPQEAARHELLTSRAAFHSQQRHR